MGCWKSPSIGSRAGSNPIGVAIGGPRPAGSGGAGAGAAGAPGTWRLSLLRLSPSAHAVVSCGRPLEPLFRLFAGDTQVVAQGRLGARKVMCLAPASAACAADDFSGGKWRGGSKQHEGCGTAAALGSTAADAVKILSDLQAGAAFVAMLARAAEKAGSGSGKSSANPAVVTRLSVRPGWMSGPPAITCTGLSRIRLSCCRLPDLKWPLNSSTSRFSERAGLEPGAGPRLAFRCSADLHVKT